MKRLLLLSLITVFISCSKDEAQPEVLPETVISLEESLVGRWQYTKRFYTNEQGGERLSQDECSLLRSYTLLETGVSELEYWGGDGEGGCEIWETFEGLWAVATDPENSKNNLLFQFRETPSSPLEKNYAYAELINNDVLHITFYPDLEDPSDEFPIFKLHLKRD